MHEGEAARRDGTASRQQSTALVEEVEIEGEAHPEGVDAGAAWDQEAGAGKLAVEEGETEQASAKAMGNRHSPAQHRSRWQALEAGGKRSRAHAQLRHWRRFSP
jgi:hypothetical protein